MYTNHRVNPVEIAFHVFAEKCTLLICNLTLVFQISFRIALTSKPTQTNHFVLSVFIVRHSFSLSTLALHRPTRCIISSILKMTDRRGNTHFFRFLLDRCLDFLIFLFFYERRFFSDFAAFLSLLR